MKIQKKSSASNLLLLSACLILLYGFLLAIRPADSGLKLAQDKTYGVYKSTAGPKETIDAVFDQVGSVNSASSQVGGLTVNHHLLAPDIIAKSLLAAGNQDPGLVVLLSPNHFDSGVGRFITTENDWDTPYGLATPDRRVIQKLDADENFQIDERPFTVEHGISNIVPYIKRVFPDAKIITIVVKEQTRHEDIDSFAELLHRTLPRNALVVGSFDFSHYLTSTAADYNDIKALAVLRNLDYAGMDYLDIDSKAGLRLMLKYLDLRNFEQFNLVAHTNSAKVTGGEALLETTSYINGYYLKGDKTVDENATMTYFGGWSRQGSAQFASLSSDDFSFEKLERLLSGSDLLFGFGETAIDRNLRRLGYEGLYSDSSFIAKESRSRQFHVHNGKILTFAAEDITVAVAETERELSGIVSQPDLIIVREGRPKLSLYNGVLVLTGFGETLFNGSISKKVEVMAGVRFGKEDKTIYLFPLKYEGSAITLQPKLEADKILNEIADRSEASLRNQIKTGIINF